MSTSPPDPAALTEQVREALYCVENNYKDSRTSELFVPPALDEAHAALDALVALHTETQKERDEAKAATGVMVVAADDLLARTQATEARADRYAQALAEMHHLIQTRRTSLHMDGTEMFAQPILAQLNGIARSALADGQEATG